MKGLFVTCIILHLEYQVKQRILCKRNSILLERLLFNVVQTLLVGFFFYNLPICEKEKLLFLSNRFYQNESSDFHQQNKIAFNYFSLVLIL